MPQFDFSTYSSQIFWLIICFAVVYFFVSKIILPRVQEILSSRKSIIDADLSMAQKLEDKINEIHIKNNSLIANANQQYQAKLDEVTKEANRKKEAMIEDLKNKIDQKIENSRKEIREFLANSKSKSSTAIDEIAQSIKAKILN